MSNQEPKIFKINDAELYALVCLCGNLDVHDPKSKELRTITRQHFAETVTEQQEKVASKMALDAWALTDPHRYPDRNTPLSAAELFARHAGHSDLQSMPDRVVFEYDPLEPA